MVDLGAGRIISSDTSGAWIQDDRLLVSNDDELICLRVDDGSRIWTRHVTGKVHRHEASGTLHGLFRVRSFTQDDAHIFMLPSQIEGEVQNVLSLVDKIYTTFGLTYHLEISTMPEDHIGDEKTWREAEDKLKNALNKLGKEYIINEGDGAFYGPKIDIHIKDAIGRTWQCGTIQLDMQLPKRFNLEYVDVDGTKKEPVMIHRVIYGSIDRFIGIITENFAGAFPLWLAPVQIKIMNAEHS